MRPMLRSLLSHLYAFLIEPPHEYDVATRHKSRLLSILLLVMIAVFIMVDTVSVLTIPDYVVPWFGYIFLGTAYMLNRLPYFKISAGLVMVMFPVVVFTTILSSGPAAHPELLGYLVLGLIVGSILLPQAGVITLAAMDILGVILLPLIAPRIFPGLGSILSPLAVLAIGTALVIVSMRHRDQLEQDRQDLLRQSEERYRMLFEEAPDGILIIDSNNRILMANAVVYQLTGYSPEEILGHGPNEFIAPEDLARRPPRPVSEMRVPGPMRRERTLVCKDQSRLNVVISSSFMPDGHFQYIIQDVTTRQKMEDALRASEEKFAKSFQSSPDAVTISSIASGKFIDLNDGFCAMSGYTREEALGRSAEELGIWENIEHRKSMVEILQREGRVRDFETMLIPKSGEPIHCLLSVELIDVAGQKCMVAITRDVTERKRIEAELRLSEERYRLVSSVISDYIFSTVLDENGAISLNWVAGAFERITGFTVEEFNERGGWFSILHPEDREKDQQDTVTLMNNQRVVSEIRIIHKDGSIRWVRSYSHPVWDEERNLLAGIYGAVQDITEQKRIEHDLRLSEERYRVVSSVISDYTFANVQNENGDIVLSWVTGAFEQISGYTFEQFNARGGWVSTIHPDDLEQDAHDMEMLRLNQQVVSEIRTIHKDGSIRWVRNYAHPIWDEQQNQLAGIYGAVQDITDRKRIETERETLIRELEAKNAELEQFTYTVSHDLKAPIITIKGFLGFLAEDALTGNVKRLEVDIQRISEAADKMQNLLNDLLELSRIGRVLNDPESVDFRELVEESEKILQGRLQGTGTRILLNGELPMIYGDRERFFEVIQNLMDNASKFMGAQPKPEIEIGQFGEVQNGLVTLYVRDNGVGIAPQFHERIFGLFNRLDPKIEGTGVGLALVRRIVELHGGKIWVESEVGQGATFFFTLPKSEK
jgi:PAS domain S-box-containing protein